MGGGEDLPASCLNLIHSKHIFEIFTGCLLNIRHYYRLLKYGSEQNRDPSNLRTYHDQGRWITNYKHIFKNK